MIYVLIILSAMHGSSSSTAEFGSADACEFAANAIRQSSVLHKALCVPKGPPLASGKERP